MQRTVVSSEMRKCACRFRQFATILFIVFSLGLTSLSSFAQIQEVELTLRLLPAQDDATRERLLRRLDEIAEPFQITPTSPGTVKEVIVRRCGFSSPTLEEGARRYNPGIDVAANVEGTPVTLPACPYWRFNVPVDVKSISTLSRTALAATGFVGNKTLESLIARNPRLLDATGKPKVSAGTVILPYETKSFTIVPRPKYANKRETALLLAKEFPTLLKSTYLDNYVERVGSKFVIDPVLGSGMGRCRGRAENWPFDSNAIADALEKNVVQGKSTRLTIGTVLIADTGLRDAELEKLPMRRNMVEGGPNAIEGEDEDKNGYTDDIFGANMSGRAGAPSAITEHADSGHGTQVASMVFGPWMNARLQALLRSRIDISAANIVQEDVVGLQQDGAPRLWVHVPPGNVERAFAYADWMQPRPILNISFKSDHPFQPLETLLRSAPYLVVVAAGNDGRPIDKERNERYPVEYRRLFEDKILSVAAHDGGNQLASFSNYGREVVDIAAPGCELIAIDGSGVTTVSSGTSLAAPLVSLTAALLYSEGILEPSQIKNRILSASHFIPDLNSVASSGILDIVKALRIYSDIIVLKAKPPEPQRTAFGRIAHQEHRICGDTLTWRSIASAIPRYYTGSENAPMRVLVRKMGRLIERHCEAPAELRFTFQDERGGPPIVLSLDDVDQIVTAIR